MDVAGGEFIAQVSWVSLRYHSHRPEKPVRHAVIQFSQAAEINCLAAHPGPHRTTWGYPLAPKHLPLACYAADSRCNQSLARPMRRELLMKSKGIKKPVSTKTASLGHVLKKNEKIKQTVKNAASELTR